MVFTIHAFINPNLNVLDVSLEWARVMSAKQDIGDDEPPANHMPDMKSKREPPLKREPLDPAQPGNEWVSLFPGGLRDQLSKLPGVMRSPGDDGTRVAMPHEPNEEPGGLELDDKEFCSKQHG